MSSLPRRSFHDKCAVAAGKHLVESYKKKGIFFTLVEATGEIIVGTGYKVTIWKADARRLANAANRLNIAAYLRDREARRVAKRKTILVLNCGQLTAH